MNTNINFNKKLLIYLYIFTLINKKITNKYQNYLYFTIFFYNYNYNFNNNKSDNKMLIDLIDFTTLNVNKNTQYSIVLQYN